jgi:hypothetical protein
MLRVSMDVAIPHNSMAEFGPQNTRQGSFTRAEKTLASVLIAVL